ncbi:MAG TPA: glycosyltransferase family 4 protein [Methanotrichaceae archaeon]|nr:glycosyltransferase family 4 protein [Methanotrichaceae archaeon]
MRIAYVYDAVYPWVKGGGERRIYELSRRLAGRGHEVHCYGIKWWDGDSIQTKDGVHLHGICRPMGLYSGDRRSVKEALLFALKILPSIKESYDIIDCQEFPYFPCFSARLVSSMMKSKLFITWLEVWGDYWQEYLGRMGMLGQAVERSCARLADQNIAISDRTKMDLEALGAKDVKVIPTGIDFNHIAGVKASAEHSDVIFAGRLAGHKNVDLLIRALARERREVPDLRAVIIGDGPERSRLEKLSLDFGLSRNVSFRGFLDDHDQVISLIKSSRVFVMPSSREGFGIAALEANACGLPVVTVDHRMNAVCDLLKEGTGFKCQVSDEDLGMAIRTGLEKGMGMRSACIDAARGYDWDDLCLAAEKVYLSED